MKVHRADNCISDLSKLPQARHAAKRVANCTHVTMDRIYGRNQQCLICGCAPSIGFLYVCRQDNLPPSDIFGHRLQQDSKQASTKSSLREQLEEIGLSESVIFAAERGEYTDAQLEKLKVLKLELKQAIEDVEQGARINSMAAKLAAFAKGPPNNDGALNSTSQKDPLPSCCNFQACHKCRPYYKDRVYTSIEAILSNELKPVTPSDAAVLPTKPASKLRLIGLLPNPIIPAEDAETSLSTFNPSTTPLTPSRASIATFKTTQTDIDDLASMRQPRRRFYNLGHRSSQEIARDLSNLPNLLTKQGLKSAIQGIFRPSRESSSSGSNITLPLSRTGTARDLHDSNAHREFDVGTLRRVRRQKEINDLRNGTYMGGFEGLGPALRPKMPHLTAKVHGEATDDGEGEESDSDFTVYSRASEGSEVEVEGGVALTEEAVETHVPDILTADLVKVPDAKVVNVEEEVENIMAQV